MGNDFGYFGDGLEGYAHYSQAFDANFSQQTTGETGFDSYGSPNEEFSADNASSQDDVFDDSEDEPSDCTGNNAGGFKISFRQPVSAAELVHRDIGAVKPYEDLSARYQFNDEAYDFRQALLEYFPEIRESYEHSPEIDYEKILAQVLLVDFDLGYRAWRWLVEHFQRCLSEEYPSWNLCTTVLYNMRSTLHLPMAKRLREDSEMLSWIFTKCYDFGRAQYDLLGACLEANDTVLFEALLQSYIIRKDWVPNRGTHFDTVLENCIQYASYSKENFEVLQKYIGMTAVGLRRKYLEKYLQQNKPEEQIMSTERDKIASAYNISSANRVSYHLWNVPKAKRNSIGTFFFSFVGAKWVYSIGTYCSVKTHKMKACCVYMKNLLA